jgi:hypothetical protein
MDTVIYTSRCRVFGMRIRARKQPFLTGWQDRPIDLNCDEIFFLTGSQDRQDCCRLRRLAYHQVAKPPEKSCQSCDPVKKFIAAAICTITFAPDSHEASFVRRNMADTGMIFVTTRIDLPQSTLSGNFIILHNYFKA